MEMVAALTPLITALLINCELRDGKGMAWRHTAELGLNPVFSPNLRLLPVPLLQARSAFSEA